MRRQFTDAPCEGVSGEVRRQESETGYVLVAYRIDFHDVELEFVQVNLPDGTTAYFTPDADLEEGFRAGPFGGGYSWAVPKYVVKAAGQLLRDVFVKGDPDEGDRVLDEQADELARSYE